MKGVRWHLALLFFLEMGSVFVEWDYEVKKEALLENGPNDVLWSVEYLYVPTVVCIV